MAKVFEILADDNRTKIESNYRFSHMRGNSYIFLNEDKLMESFQKVESCASWHLRYKKEFFEFCSSLR